jgi:tRNA(Ile2) C34 agmatinyltransferase TiaS
MIPLLCIYCGSNNTSYLGKKKFRCLDCLKIFDWYNIKLKEKKHG